MTKELETALAEIKFGMEADGKTAADLVDYSEDLLNAHDALIMALAKAAVFDRIATAAMHGETFTVNPDAVSLLRAEVGLEVGRILKPEAERRAQAGKIDVPGFSR